MISLQNVTYKYPTSSGYHEAIQSLSFSIQKGEWVAFIGPNGSGKSTLGKLINGLLVPSDGEVLVDGSLRQRVQMIFQNPDSQRIGGTPLEDLLFSLEDRVISRLELHQRVYESLSSVGLLQMLHKPVATLSGGQKQRLAIAACLAIEPSVLIFDEATSMLDPSGRQEIRATVRQLHQKGMTVIWITQRLDELVDAQRVIALESGQVVFDGTPHAFFYPDMRQGQAVDWLDRWKWPAPLPVEIGRLAKQREMLSGVFPLTEDELVKGRIRS